MLRKVEVMCFWRWVVNAECFCKRKKKCADSFRKLRGNTVRHCERMRSNPECCVRLGVYFSGTGSMSLCLLTISG